MLTVVVKGSFLEASCAIQKANACAQACEFRLDLLDDLDAIKHLRSICLVPVIFTWRGPCQSSLLSLLPLSPDYVDFSSDVDDATYFLVSNRYPHIQIIHSIHVNDHTPEDLTSLLNALKRRPACIYKIATFASSSLDSLRMLVFIQKKRKEGISLAGMCMGEKGSITRILAPVVKSLVTYAPIKNEDQTAEGQITLSELLNHYHFHQLNASTKLYGLIGNPIENSLGHFLHNHLFEQLNLNAVYVKMALKKEEVALGLKLLTYLPFQGLSVTMPLKEALLQHLKIIRPEVKAIRAVNTLIRRGDTWEGRNTDGEGGIDALEKQTKMKGKKILIFGAGGVAKALTYEVLKRGGRVTLVNRTQMRAEKLAAYFKCQSISMEMKNPKEFYDVLINATSAIEVPSHLLSLTRIVFDTNYHVRPHLPGIEMFVRQAVKQLEVWLNRSLQTPDLIQQLLTLCEKEWS